jgi:alpha-tubulin suppressor-like RCC1 family protein
MSRLQDVARNKVSDRILAAKRGAVPYLAVATEQGTVYIWDTSKREELGQGQLSQSARARTIVHDYVRQTRSGLITISTKTVYSTFSGLPMTAC